MTGLWLGAVAIIVGCAVAEAAGGNPYAGLAAAAAVVLVL